MGNYCSSTRSRLKKSEIDGLTVLIMETATSIDFYRRLDELCQQEYGWTKKRRKGVFRMVRDVMLSKTTFKHKFFAVVFVNTLVAKDEIAAIELSNSPLVCLLMMQLREEYGCLRTYYSEDRVKHWRERYFIICAETLYLLTQHQKSLRRKCAEWFGTIGPLIGKNLFYTSFGYESIQKIQLNIGIITREATYRNQRQFLKVYPSACSKPDKALPLWQ